ncbi:PRC-barrel domain protein [Candidatus Gugararchaeum adminiculabundum]|nr:PRC-barrel domain protein [Candidatus Gugararchaeum adminiculabundum]
MSVRLSKMYGMDIYTDNGKFLGRVNDLIIDLEKGEVVRITMEPLTSTSREEAKRILKDKSVLFKSVRSVEDVVVVAAAGKPVATPGGPAGMAPRFAPQEEAMDTSFLGG